MGEKQGEIFHEQEDKAAANIGRDDALPKNLAKEQESLHQRQGDWDHKDRMERLQQDADELHAELKEKGIMDDYKMVWSYVQSGGRPSTEEEEIAFPQIEKIDDIDPEDKEK